jgi:large subunit ribosomal protein L9
MEVILLERIEKLGKLGDVVKVRQGFARNFLFPKNKAIRASKDNLVQFETQKADLEALNLQHKDEAEILGTRLEGVCVVVIRQASDSGQLFGSVSARDIAEGLVVLGHKSVDRNQVILNHPLKLLGLHPVRIKLHPEVSATVHVNIAKTEEEARVKEAKAFKEAKADKADAAAE